MFRSRTAFLAFLALGLVGQTLAADRKPNIIVLLADDKCYHSMHERCFLHEKYCFTWIISDVRMTPNCGQFSPIL
jgi:hypothetical protein